MRAFLLLSKQLVNKSSLNVFQTNRNGFLRNRSEIIKKCLYSTSTTSAATDEVIAPPVVSIEDKQYPQKITKIVNDISNLTLLEVSELNELLKKTLNIADTPMMAMGSMPFPTPSAQVEDEEEDIGSKTVQTSFTLKLNKFEDTKKVALIKEIKAVVEGMNLVQAKKFVESVPQIIKSNLPKAEAEKLKATLEAVGGECVIE